jgi:hypothetical protein
MFFSVAYLKNFADAFPMRHDSAVNAAHNLVSQFFNVDWSAALINRRPPARAPVDRRFVYRWFGNSLLRYGRGLSIYPSNKTAPRSLLKSVSLGDDSADHLRSMPDCYRLKTPHIRARLITYLAAVEDSDESRRGVVIR